MEIVVVLLILALIAAVFGFGWIASHHHQFCPDPILDIFDSFCDRTGSQGSYRGLGWASPPS